MENTLENTMSTAWKKSKWVVKGCIIGVLALMMMIPMLYVKSLVYERQERQEEATREIAGKWAGRQNIIGPIIGIPFWKEDEDDTTGTKRASKHIAYFLPDNLRVDASVEQKEKHRGIFKVILYDAKATITGSFTKLSIEKLKIPDNKFIWSEAFVTMSIADNKGLNDQLNINWKDSLLELSPEQDRMNGKMVVSIPAVSAEDFTDAHFSTTLDINGSEQLFFTPIGKSTIVNIRSGWKHPSFSGNMLPQTTEVNDTGFTATWKSMSHKRNFPQQWIDNDFLMENSFPAVSGSERLNGSSQDQETTKNLFEPTSMAGSAFGVNLFIPVNGYQKTLRTIKYSLLCILLTFAAFFLIETSNKKSAHPFQYGLIGLALILFYTLLLSISEYTGFNTAYLISSAATIGLIAWFVKSILQSGKATTILSVVLVLIYSYLFSLLQLQDYSLLLGSIGLFLTLAVVMYFSKKLQW